MLLDLKGKKGLIIGIANEQSIAYGCAQAFKLLGADLAITYLNDKAKTYVEPIANQLNASILFPCDVRIDGQLESLFAQIEEKWGKLDFMLHSIAYAPKDSLLNRVTDSKKGDFAEAMHVSCYSFIQACQLAEPLMKDGGSALTVSYYGGEKVIKNYNIMGVIKAALESAARYVASDLGPKNIRVNAISPGPIMTRAASGIKDFYELYEHALQKSFLGRLATLESIGNLAAFLVSEASRDITGQVYHIDCGTSSSAN